MAEKFDEVLKKLEKATKRPSAPKATAAIAVQIVDDVGEPIEMGADPNSPTGAKATEEKREAEKLEKDRNKL